MMSIDNRRKLKDYFMALDELKQVELIKKTAQTLHAEKKKKDRALEAERHAPARTGVRGGKATTLSANASNAAEAYEGTKEMLKLYTQLLF